MRSAPARSPAPATSSAKFIAWRGDYEAPDRLDPRFDPPYSTLHVGTIAGGTARNILARECAFHWEFRGLPGVPTIEALALVQSYIDERATSRRV